MGNQVLRPYQIAANHAIYNCLEDNYNRVLLCQCTASGKTTTLAEMIKRFVRDFHYKVLFLADRRELISQAFRRIKDHAGLTDWEIGCEIAEYYAPESAKVVVGSIQTISNPKRLQWFYPDVIVYDEAQHCTCPTAIKLFNRYKVFEGKCILLGCTATPKRADKKSLYARGIDGNIITIYNKKLKKQIPADETTSPFQIMAYDYDLITAIEEGYVVNIRGGVVVSDTDLNDIPVTYNTITGEKDFSQKELAKAVDNEQRTTKALSEWRRIASDRPTIIFAASVEHARHMAQAWTDNGYPAVALDGETDKSLRYETLDKFNKGKLQVIANYGLFVEGTDLPPASCAILARPTQSWTLYCLDKETEILTSHGWRGIGNIKVGDCVPTMDLTTGKGKWSNVTGYIERDMLPTEKWIEYTAPRANFRVTDQHNMIYKTRHGGKHIWTEWTLEPAHCMAKCINQNIRVPTAVEIDQIGVPLNDTELYFIGMMMTDGTFSSSNATIYQSERYPEVIKRIEKMLNDCQFSWRKVRYDAPTQFNSRFTRWRYTISAGKTPRTVYSTPPYLRGIRKDKGPESEWHEGITGYRHLMPYMDKDFAPALMGLSKHQFLTLIKAMHDGDGIKHENADYTPQSWQIVSARLLCVERLQALAAIHGCTGQLRTEHRENSKSIYVLTITPKNWRSISGYDDGRRPLIQVNQHTNERVWCIETDTGTIITRRHGKVMVMGNCQQAGRVGRVLPGVIDGIDSVEKRISAIAQSVKKDGLLIDVVDNCKKHSLCSAPSILDLPADLNMEGATITEVKKMLDRYKEVEEKVLAERPKTYTQLQTRLMEVDLLRHSKAKSTESWQVTDTGYRLSAVPPGYSAHLTQEGDHWRLCVTAPKGGGEIYNKTGFPRNEFREYLDRARDAVMKSIREYKANLPLISKGTLSQLSEKQINCLSVNGHTKEEIDALSSWKAKNLIKTYMTNWKQRQGVKT